MIHSVALHQPKAIQAVRFGTTPPGSAGETEFIARLKGIEASLKDGTLTLIEADIPSFIKGRDLDEAFITGTLQKADGQKYTLTMGGNMSGRSFTLENEAKTVKYQYSIQCFRVDVDAFDQRPGKEFSYSLKNYDLSKKNATMEQLAAQARQMRNELVKAVKTYQEKPKAPLAEIPENRDF
jgi:hypothetical protein